MNWCRTTQGVLVALIARAVTVAVLGTSLAAFGQAGAQEQAPQ